MSPAPAVALCALLLNLVSGPGSAQDLSFRAAGVMPYVLRDDGPWFLIGGEYRADCFNRRPGFCWSTFVGRRNPSESVPQETAVREFHEETRYAFVAADELSPDPGRLAEAEPLPTHKRGIYVFLLEVPYVEPEQIRGRLSVRETEKTDYCWVSLPQLLDAVDSPPHTLPPHCGESDQRLFDIFRRDLTGTSAIRSSVQALVPDQARADRPAPSGSDAKAR